MHPQELKHLLMMDKPSLHLRWMAQTGKLDPDLSILMSIPQDVDHHPEGSAYNHTLMVVDKAIEISRRERLDDFDHAVLFLSALTHDMGKATHTQISDNGKITAYGHAEAGVKPAEAFLRRSHVSEIVIGWVLPMVQYHMAWVGFYTPDITTKAVRKLNRKVMPATMEMLLMVVEADMSGRGGKWYNQGVPQRMIDIMTVYATIHETIERYPEPFLNGDELMKLLHLKPSPELGKVKSALYAAQLRGEIVNKDEALDWIFTHVVLT